MIGLALTPEQFKVLLRMVYIANTVANGHRDADFMTEYDELEQYVFSRAKDAGFPAATWRHELGGEEHHHPSRVFEADPEVNTVMDAYDEHIMFERLAERLALRDMEQKYGLNVKEKMPEKDYDELLGERADAYEKFFADNGDSVLLVNGIVPF
jgi:hypothetical protein